MLNVVLVGLPSVVLPVVGIDTETPIVLNVVYRAERGLVVEHEEIVVKNLVMQQLSENVVLAVGVRAVFPKLTFVEVIWKVDTEPLLIIVRVIIELD